MCGQEDNLTPNERAWLRFLREVSNDSDPKPTLRRVQLLWRLCALRRASDEGGSGWRRGMARPPCLAGSLHDVYIGLTDLYTSKRVGNLKGSIMGDIALISGFDLYPMFT